MGRLRSGTFGATGGGHPHCVVLGNDGYVYACDRPDSRIQVFRRDCGAFKNAAPEDAKAVLLAGTKAAESCAEG